MNIKKYIFLVFYYGFFSKLPRSSTPVIGRFCKDARYFCVKNIFKTCGKEVNIEKNAYFGKGFEVEIGDYSGIGYSCIVPPNIKIGRYVMMGPEVFIPHLNHEFSDINMPMCLQGVKPSRSVVIGDDVWIGRRVIINAGREIRTGSILASGTVLIKDFPAYSIIGGNPSVLISKRN